MLDKTGRISKYAKMKFQSILAQSWPLHGVYGLQPGALFTTVVTENPLYITSDYLISEWTSAFSIKQFFFDSLPFSFTVGGQVVVYPSWRVASIALVCQLPQSNVIWTVMQLSSLDDQSEFGAFKKKSLGLYILKCDRLYFSSEWRTLLRRFGPSVLPVVTQVTN